MVPGVAKAAVLKSRFDDVRAHSNSTVPPAARLLTLLPHTPALSPSRDPARLCDCRDSYTPIELILLEPKLFVEDPIRVDLDVGMHRWWYEDGIDSAVLECEEERKQEGIREMV